MEHFDWVMGFIFPYINFAIFLFLAIKFFRKPLAEMVKGRRTEFDRLVAEASKAREEAEKQKRELDARMSSLAREVEEIKAKTRADAEQEAAAILQDAERLARHVRDEAARIADNEVKRARDTLQAEIMAAAKANVATMIGSELDTEKHLALARKQISRLDGLRAEG